MYNETIEYNLIKTLWLSGLSISGVAFTIQVLVLVVFSWSRRFDEIVITQLAAARIANSISEFLILYGEITLMKRNVLFFFSFYTDFVLVCWMFVFTKNLYNKFVIVFTSDCNRWFFTSAIVWAIPLPVGLGPAFDITIDQFLIFYNVYCVLKFLLLIIISIIFIKMLRVAVKSYRSDAVNKKLRDTLKICIFHFIILCISCLQVLLTDIISTMIYSNLLGDSAILWNCVVNSYQVCAVFVIFVILVKGHMKKDKIKTILRRFSSVLRTNSSSIRLDSLRSVPV